MHFLPIRKYPHDRILKEEPKEQRLSTVPKSCSLCICQPERNKRELGLTLRIWIEEL